MNFAPDRVTSWCDRKFITARAAKKVVEPKPMGQRMNGYVGMENNPEISLDTPLHWTHELRNALCVTLLSATDARAAFDARKPSEGRAALDRVEQGCQRCLDTLMRMP